MKKKCKFEPKNTILKIRLPIHIKTYNHTNNIEIYISKLIFFFNFQQYELLVSHQSQSRRAVTTSEIITKITFITLLSNSETMHATDQRRVYLCLIKMAT